ncbi:MAG: glycosyl transferase family 2 [Planctomycetota bacterium]|nr:glycosyl transferase family 2 [Planctomycetota bacterium]
MSMPISSSERAAQVRSGSPTTTGSLPRSSSVLIPSYNRPARLLGCLTGLANQELAPDEVIVVWQGDDTATRDAAETMIDAVPYRLRILHSPEKGVVPAENLALDASIGELILLIDDDAVPPTDWFRRHLSFYADATVGAVGGPADNFLDNGKPFPRRDREPTGRLTWWGKPVGNMYDHDPSWRTRPPRDVHHLVGYNMSLRRSAFDRFESALRPYWSMFEMDACLQVASRGYRVLFDYGNVVEHHPTNTIYKAGREGDLTVKVVNVFYNQSFILSRWTEPRLRFWRFLYMLVGGTREKPGFFFLPFAILRHGHPIRELRLFGRTTSATIEGWRDGAVARQKFRGSGSTTGTTAGIGNSENPASKAQAGHWAVPPGARHPEAR